MHGLFRSPAVPPGLSMCECGVCWLQPGLPRSTIHHLAGSTSRCFSSSPLHLGCPPPPLLPVWMNVSSLTPWLSDFHAVQFSVSSGCFLFLNFLLSFFRLCEEAQCVYLRLPLGRKSLNGQNFMQVFFNTFTDLKKCGK